MQQQASAVPHASTDNKQKVSNFITELQLNRQKSQKRDYWFFYDYFYKPITRFKNSDEDCYFWCS